MRVKKQPGRPRIYESEAHRKRIERARAREEGCKVLYVTLPLEYKILLDRFCEEHNLTQLGAICYLLDLHYNFSEPTSN